MVLGKHLILYDLGVPLVSIAQVRGDILSVFDLLPVNIGVSANHTNLVLASSFQVCLANSLIERRIHWRRRSDDTRHVPPGFLPLFERDIFAALVAID